MSFIVLFIAGDMEEINAVQQHSVELRAGEFEMSQKWRDLTEGRKRFTAD